MNAALILAMALTSAGFANADPPSCASSAKPHLRVRLTVDAESVHPTVPVIRNIVDAVWNREGVTFEWVEDRGERDKWQGIDLWIAVLSGTPISQQAGVLGHVMFHEGVPFPLIRISIDAAMAWVRRYEAKRFAVYTPFETFSIADTAPLVARTLGYAAAHEIGHFVLASPAHATSGVMQAIYRRPRAFYDPSSMRLDAASRVQLGRRLAQGAACRARSD